LALISFTHIHECGQRRTREKQAQKIYVALCPTPPAGKQKSLKYPFLEAAQHFIKQLKQLEQQPAEQHPKRDKKHSQSLFMLNHLFTAIV